MSTPTHSPSRPVARDLDQTVFEGVTLSLVDLQRTCLRKGELTIVGRTFDNCLIEGPAVMLALDNVTFDGVDFGYTRGDIRNIVLFPASPTAVIGAIPVKDCVFRNSTFFAVGFTGPTAFTDQILALGDKS
jgi:hypothetical protein